MHESILEILKTSPRLPFAGKSMLPLFKEGDELIVDYGHSSAPLEFEFGDLVLLKADDRWVVHRIVSDHRTKGDRSLVYDSTLESENQKFWGRIDGFKSATKTFYWGSAGMRFKKQVAALSEKATTRIRAKRWLALITLWLFVKLSLLTHRVRQSPT